MKKYKILFADLDDTLIKTTSGKTFAQGIWDMTLRLDVFKKIKELEPEYVFIVTNQGGIGRFVIESEFENKLNYVTSALKSYIRHPKLVEVESMYCASMSETDPFRKPNPGMIEYFLHTYIPEDKTYSSDEILMIGDASGKPGNFSDTDKKTAENAGIKYIDVEDFLKISFI